MANDFEWWWQNKKQLALWEKLQKKVKLVNNRLVVDVPDKLKRDLTERYGNIYWYRPSDKLIDFHKDPQLEKLVHGNNSSGKSYAVAAEVAYEAIGWSPYRKIEPAKYGHKLIWAFSPTYDIQRSSSQVHLFSTDSVHDIGLLPSFNTIKKFGGQVQWGANRALNFVDLPDKTRIEFKSEEASTHNMQASGVDIAWFDEKPKSQKMRDEVSMRLIRKNGKLFMSYILDLDEMKSHWIVKDLYEPVKQGVEGAPPISFYFIGIDDNDYLTPEEKEMAKQRAAGKGKEWRFSQNGEFLAITSGDLVFTNATDQHVQTQLLEAYDPRRTLFRFWDSGYNRPAVLGVQLAEGNVRKYLFAHMGERQHIIEYLDEVEAYTKEMLPKLLVKKDMLPHDTNRRYSTGVTDSNGKVRTEKDIFEEDYHLDVEILYYKRDKMIQNANEQLRKSVKADRMIQADADHAGLLIDCWNHYVMDEEKGEPKRDKYYEHIADCFLKAEAWFQNQVDLDDLEFVEPKYHNIDLSTGTIL